MKPSLPVVGSAARPGVQLTNPADSTIVESLAVAPFIDGTFPYSTFVGFSYSSGKPFIRDYLPDKATIRRVYEANDTSHVWATGPNWSLYARLSGVLNFWIYGDTCVTCQDVEAALKEKIGERPEEPSVVPVGFWCAGQVGATRSERSISALTWPEIAGNYPKSAAQQLTSLMEMDPERLAGSILLLYGPPGTGKTTVLRALAQSWRKWCQTDYIIDPEHLFSNANYINSACLGVNSSKPWRLLILEDCDELIQHNAKQRSGMALAKLLNLSDGFLGQGQNLLLAITTNEPIMELHPAVSRPGRCFAAIEVGPLSREEGHEWLGSPIEHPMTLAELFEARGDLDKITHLEEKISVGQYL